MKKQNAKNAPARLLRIVDVTARTGLSRSRIYELERDGQFPIRRQLSARAVAWNEREIDAWIESRPLAACGNTYRFPITNSTRR